jgi:hypothetical protein
MKNILKSLESQGLIERVSTGSKQAASNLLRARKDLLTAKATIVVDEEWAYTIAYHAMLRAGRALMFSMGYRPKGKDQHNPDHPVQPDAHETSRLYLRTGTSDPEDRGSEILGKRRTICKGDSRQGSKIGPAEQVVHRLTYGRAPPMTIRRAYTTRSALSHHVYGRDIRDRLS